MPNFLDISRARSAAEAAVRGTLPVRLRRRLFALILQTLVRDAANARLARAAEIDAAPPWARRAREEGRALHVFVLRAPTRAWLKQVRLDLREAALALCAADTRANAAGRWLIERCGRMALRDLQSALNRVAAAWRAEREARQAQDERPLCPPAMLACESGRQWDRVRSKAELGRKGRALRNCCDPRRKQHLVYARSMAAGAAEFWALHDCQGQCVGLAHIDLISLRLTQARGFRNADLPALDDLRPLLDAVDTAKADRDLSPARVRYVQREGAPDLAGSSPQAR